MANRPEYLRFVEADAGARKTRIVEVRSVSSDVHLGTIAWYPAWRQYTWWPQPNTLFNGGCLVQITEELQKMMDDWRASKRSSGAQ